MTNLGIKFFAGAAPFVIAVCGLAPAAYAQTADPQTATNTAAGSDQTSPSDVATDDQQTAPDTAPTDNRTPNVGTEQGEAQPKDIVVVGIKAGIASALEKKRTSNQFVDTVNAQDQGKLPDNGVVDTLSRVTGVAIDRALGRGSSLTIRGLSGVQTTINGNEVTGPSNPNGSSDGRALELADIPSELIKAVNVYKTRTANQVEGGIAGTVNVELRRPLELKPGLTVAGSVRGLYDSLADRVSPFASLLVSDSIQTGIGKIGALINLGYQDQYYYEPTLRLESLNYVNDRRSADDLARSALYQSLPAANKNALLPYQGFYGVDYGRRRLPSGSAVLQWQPSDRLNFILEGNYFGNRSDAEFSNLNINLREDRYQLSNVVVGESGAVTSATYTSLNERAFGGVSSGLSKNNSDNYHTNFETHWNGSGVRIDASAQYDWGGFSNRSRAYYLIIAGLRTFNFDVNSPDGKYIDLGSSQVSAENLRVNSFRDSMVSGKNESVSGQVDVNIDVSSRKLLRSLQIGARIRKGTNSFEERYREGNLNDAGIAVENLPQLNSIDGIRPASTTVGYTWARFNNQDVYANFDKVRALLFEKKARVYGPGARALGSKAYTLFNNPDPDPQPANGNVNDENVFAAYINAQYALKLIFPIEGSAGLRVANTWGQFKGNFIIGAPLVDGNPVLDENGNPIGDEVRTSVGRGNYVDLFPSVNSIVHLTSSLQLRAAWSRNVDRPGFGALSPAFYISPEDVLNPGAPIFTGNPNLKAATTTDYNVALEYFFGRGGILAVTGFLKRQNGLTYYAFQNQPVPQLNNQVRRVGQLRNGGRGATSGIEAQANSFLTFLPGFAKNFGVTANATWIPEAYQEVYQQTDPFGDTTLVELVKSDYPGLSKLTYNLIGYYETPIFSARVAYNWRSKVVYGIDRIRIQDNTSARPRSRLDAAVNLTPIRALTLSLEATNILKSLDRNIYEAFPEIPNSLRQGARTVQASARFRF